MICCDLLSVSSEGHLIKLILSKQGCHLPRWYGLQTISDLAELILCSHQCIKLAFTAGWPLAQHDGQGYQEGRGWQDSILSRLHHHNCLPVKPVESTWPPVTDMQHYYHARYPTNDWHLACMFSLVYFSIEVCLLGVSKWSDPCIRTCIPLLNWRPPLMTKQYRTRGDPVLHLSQARGHLNWCMGLPALLGGNLGCWIL